MKKQIDWPKLSVAVVTALIAGSSGAIFTADATNTWYKEIAKPWFTPPSWVFGPAWTILFVLMGLAFYLVWNKGLNNYLGKAALKAYIAQFIFNVAWSGIFFGFGLFWLAFAEIVFLWWLIYKTIVNFSKVDALAGKLLWPYLGWVSFASILNLAVAVLN